MHMTGTCRSSCCSETGGTAISALWECKVECHVFWVGYKHNLNCYFNFLKSNDNSFVRAFKELNVKHIKSLQYKPSSNGQVEIFNKTIKEIIWPQITQKGI